MNNQNRMRSIYRLSALILSILLTACSSAPIPTPSTTPSPTPNLEVEAELVATLLDTIIQNIQRNGSVDGYLIVWSPVQSSHDSPTLRMDITAPIEVWWYDGGQLTEAGDPVGAIEQFRQEQMAVEPYGLYDFGILSVIEDGKVAEVYIGFDCGGLDCHGSARYFYLERTDQGTWEVSRDRVSIMILE